MTGKDPVRTLDKASPVWITPTVLLSALVAFGAWCMYYNKFPDMAENTTPLTSAAEPFFDWQNNKPKTMGIVLFAIGLFTLITGWGVALYSLLSDKPLPPLKADMSLLPLLVLIPVSVFVLYKFGTGSQFPHLAILVMTSVAITVAALISSQSQVNA